MRCSIGKIVVFAVVLVLTTTASADGFNTIVVTTTDDGLNEFDGQCSLREAIHNVRLGLQFSPLPGECAPGSTSMTNRIVLQSGGSYSLTVPGDSDDQGDLVISALDPSEEPDLIIATDGVGAALIQQTVVGQRVMNVTSAWIELDNLVITGGALTSPVDGGGGIQNLSSGTLVLRNSVVTANSARGGGGIRNTGLLFLFDSQVTNNQSPNGVGGGLHNLGDGEVEVRGGRFLGNSAGAGGAIFHQGGSLDLENVDLESNSSLANIGGGGAIVREVGSLSIINSRFLNNTASSGGSGGALHHSGPSGGRFTIRDSLFQANRAPAGQGGAIWHEGSLVVYIENSHLIDNSAVEGGAVWQKGTNFVWLDDSVIRDNLATGSGGALHVRGARSVRSHFDNNESESGSGGAIYAELFTGLSDSVFINNRAAIDGGAIHQRNFADGTRDTLFQNNRAGGNGGALYAARAINSERMRFFDNHSTNGHGGAIYSTSVLSIAGVMRQSLFHLNSAINGQGGALWLRRPFGPFTLANSTIAGNSASSEGGGGIYVSADTIGDGEIISINNTIAGNLGGQDIVKMGNMTLENTIIATADQDNCLTPLNNPAFNSLGHNISNDDSCTGLDLGSDMPNTNPMLGGLDNFGGNTLTIELLPGSPAIDAGNNLTCFLEPIDGVDQRGGLRPQQGCDIGAHEQEFVFDLIFGDRFQL